MENKPLYEVEENDENGLAMMGKGYNEDPIPPTQFVSTMTGVTPVPDLLIQEYGYVTALVWGMVRRYCDMADGVCRAATDKIGERIGMSSKTIMRHLNVLCDGGYLFDMTPELKNRPHIYADTMKVKIKISFEAARTESPSHSDFKSHEESTTKREKIGEANIFTLYEENIGVITPMIANTLQDAEKEYPAKWIEDAISLAVQNNKRNWRYCDVILRRWKENGKDEGKGKPAEENPKPTIVRHNPEEEKQFVPPPPKRPKGI